MKIGLSVFLLLSGCSTFFQERVKEHDRAIGELVEERDELLERLSAADGSVPVEKFDALRLDIDRERRERDDALVNASEEIKYKHSILAAVLGMGSVAVSILVGKAKKSMA